jgi:hypothetical protein
LLINSVELEFDVIAFAGTLVVCGDEPACPISDLAICSNRLMG